MSPELFIKKHITDALLREGFTAEVARGGQVSGLITTGAALSPAGRGACFLIAFSAPASGLLDRLQARNARQRKSREEKWLRPACSDFALKYLLAEPTFTGAVP